jgi:hypothetical protein
MKNVVAVVAFIVLETWFCGDEHASVNCRKIGPMY